MVTLESLSFFHFQVEGEDRGIIVFLHDLADRAHLNDRDFEQQLPPRYDADRFLKWCEDRNLNPVRDTSEDDLWEIPEITDPALRFEFRMFWGR
ncbi:MAG: hypothetical protein EOP83_10770 [Verrucomicrobiaceae bacterium]|nr:MAG: hypothetical protein EOP83_10770 [Verrucomicrobiaceae bacterium]